MRLMKITKDQMVTIRTDVIGQLPLKRNSKKDRPKIHHGDRPLSPMVFPPKWLLFDGLSDYEYSYAVLGLIMLIRRLNAF